MRASKRHKSDGASGDTSSSKEMAKASSSKKDGEAAAKPSPIDVISELRGIVAGLAGGLQNPMTNTGAAGASDASTTTGQQLCLMTNKGTGATIQHATLQVWDQ